MSPIEKLKAEAVALRAKEKAAGRPMGYCAALERVAKSHGYRNWRSCAAICSGTSPSSDNTDASNADLKCYESPEWGFSLQLPKRWNAFPPVSTNSRYEVIRFASQEDGVHLLIIFRRPRDPKKTLQKYVEYTREELTKLGFGNFRFTETVLRSKPAAMLDFDKTQGDGIWSCREYFVDEGTLSYALGFGTDQGSKIFDFYDRIAKTFEIVVD
jgi:hypothetical protein